MLPDLAKKELAIKLRKQGKSYRDIEKEIGVNRSTLSGWLKNIELTEKQKSKLNNNWLNALVRARKEAALVHKKDRAERIEKIKQEVEFFLKDIKIDKKTGELLMAAFYLAEGGKTESNFVIANSNPQILQGIINLHRYLYNLDETKFRCCLHLRKDQDEKKLKSFWSKLLKIPENKFTKTQFDKRTVKKTYEDYKGVCVVNYFDMALQRRIMFIGDKLLEMIK